MAPHSIETAVFADLAQRSVRLPFVKRVIKSLADRALIFGVDRLDYSKAIGQRLSAFELFLQTQPFWRGKVTYLQIVPRAALRFRNMPIWSGRSDRPRDASTAPIRYINRAYSHTTLAGLYRAARVGLVTPLRDNMNLVAKEYVASQNPNDPGVTPSDTAELCAVRSTLPADLCAPVKAESPAICCRPRRFSVRLIRRKRSAAPCFTDAKNVQCTYLYGRTDRTHCRRR